MSPIDAASVIIGVSPVSQKENCTERSLETSNFHESSRYCRFVAVATTAAAASTTTKHTKQPRFAIIVHLFEIFAIFIVDVFAFFLSTSSVLGSDINAVSPHIVYHDFNACWSFAHLLHHLITPLPLFKYAMVYFLTLALALIYSFETKNKQNNRTNKKCNRQIY